MANRIRSLIVLTLVVKTLGSCSIEDNSAPAQTQDLVCELSRTY